MPMMMMEARLLECWVRNSWCKLCGISRAYGVLFYSTETVAASVSASASRETLFSRISPLGNPRVSIVPTLDQWVKEERAIDPREIKIIIKQLRNYRRYGQALQVSEWVDDKGYLELSPGDVAIRLDLISKVHGLERAEEYFNKFPSTFIVAEVYSALLNCYARAKSLEKAEAAMQMVRLLDSSKGPLPYNVMLNLYYQLGKHEKLDSLVQEMEEKGIVCDEYTFSIRLSAYVVTSDIAGMEKLLMQMEADPNVSMSWTIYVIAANGYVKAGLMEKASVMLKQAEQLIRVKERSGAYQVLLTQYARVGNKDEVYRIWNLFKKLGKVYNKIYLCVMSSLVKLDDFDGVEAIFEEWEAKGTSFDVRIPNFLISAYCRKGLLEKAESIVRWLTESGKEPNADTWDHLATGYLENNHLAKAVDTMKKAILASPPGSKLKLTTLAGCIVYLKGRGDAEVAEFRTLLKEQSSLSINYDELEHYIRKWKPRGLDPMGHEDHDQAPEGEMPEGDLDLKTKHPGCG